MAGSYYYANEGGDLTFHAEVGPPPLAIAIEVDGSGIFDPQTGLATLSGTVTCSRPVYLDLQGQLHQKVLGHLSVDGEFYSSYEECDGEMEWSLVVDPGEDGFFKGGKAVVNGWTCGGDYLEGTCVDFDEVVALKGKK